MQPDFSCSRTWELAGVGLQVSLLYADRVLEVYGQHSRVGIASRQLQFSPDRQSISLHPPTSSILGNLLRVTTPANQPLHLRFRTSLRLPAHQYLLLYATRQTNKQPHKQTNTTPTPTPKYNSIINRTAIHSQCRNAAPQTPTLLHPAKQPKPSPKLPPARTATLAAQSRPRLTPTATHTGISAASGVSRCRHSKGRVWSV